MVRLRARNAFAYLLGLGLLLAGPALASDYANQCRSADGSYAIHDGLLERTGEPGQSVAYGIAAEQVLSETQGYCVSNDSAANGARYSYISRAWRQTIVVSEGGQEARVEMICQLDASGLPAAYNCDRDVVTRTETAPGPVQSHELGAPGTWSHNGSTMKLEAIGADRRSVYMLPRQGLLAAGVRPGMDSFNGARQGSTYSGTARYWSTRCGVQSFAVSGPVSADERVVTLEGAAPRLDEACRQTGMTAQKLVFERH